MTIRLSVTLHQPGWLGMNIASRLPFVQDCSHSGEGPGFLGYSSIILAAKLLRKLSMFGCKSLSSP